MNNSCRVLPFYNMKDGICFKESFNTCSCVRDHKLNNKDTIRKSIVNISHKFINYSGMQSSSSFRERSTLAIYALSISIILRS